ncbi:hypothetical protein GQ600_10815 [Phytophthora cactorum]|nr:hypothetical protein GQ600_10815 [Phytophthora cactorum]
MQTACWRSLVQSQERRKHSKGVGASAGESAACPPAYCCVLASLERWFCTRLCSSNDAYELAACKPVCHACSDSTFAVPTPIPHLSPIPMATGTDQPIKPATVGNNVPKIALPPAHSMFNMLLAFPGAPPLMFNPQAVGGLIQCRSGSHNCRHLYQLEV